MSLSGGRAWADRRFISCASLCGQLSLSTATTTQLLTTSQHFTAKNKHTLSAMKTPLWENNWCKMMSLQRGQIPHQLENIYFMMQLLQHQSCLSDPTAKSKDYSITWNMYLLWCRAAYVTSQSCYVTLFQLGYYSRAHFLKKKKGKENQTQALW